MGRGGEYASSARALAHEGIRLDSLIERLRERGHVVDDLLVAPDAHHLEAYVDNPPYSASPHLRLELEGPRRDVRGDTRRALRVGVPA